MLVALGGWLLHVAALALAPLSVVQATLSGGLIFLAVFAERVFGLGVERRQWISVGLTASGSRCWRSPCPPGTAPTRATRWPA